MSAPEAPELAPPQRLAVAWTPPRLQPKIEVLLSFDTQMGRVISTASEPMLGQIRLAWWREELAKPREARAVGNPELERLGAEWEGEEGALSKLIDGWENLLGEAPLTDSAILAHAEGRGAGFAGLARLAGDNDASARAALAGRRFALADLASRTGDERERRTCKAVFLELGDEPVRLPRSLRGAALLDGLARRSMARDEPMLGGRSGALVALRLGMFGR